MKKRQPRAKEEALNGLYYNVTSIDRGHGAALVRNKNTGEILAEKTIPADRKTEYELLRTARLPGVPRISDIIDNGDDLIVIEEYIHGMSLNDIMSKRDMSLYEVIETVCRLCDLLSPMHNLTPSIIHGNLDPDKILISQDKKIFIVGIEAPKPAGDLPADPFIDIRALGAVMDAMLRGRAGNELRTDKKMNSMMEHIKTGCTSRDPAERYKTVLELKTDLLQIEPMTTKEQFYDEVTERAKSFAPPGFRERKAWKMAVAAVSYFLMFIIAFNIDFETDIQAQATCEKLFCFFGFLCAVFVIMDYLGIQSHLPLARSDNAGMHIAGIVVWAVAGFFVLTALGGLISVIFT
ncbi:MAG: hypothetical protein LKJ83_10315 [Eubacteriaceae bacterium]|jgi:Protein kinase domain.|nr:hypothetical protein [Eubacteriaceae bacterium]